MTTTHLPINPLSLTSKIALKGLDKDKIEKLILREEKNLKCMHAEFFGAITLQRLQLKLINALKYLLNLISKPNVTMHELMQQLSRISALYFEIHGELEKAKRHQEALMHDIQAQELKQHEMMKLLLESYYEVSIIVQYLNACNEMRKKRAETVKMDEQVPVKGVFENMRKGLSLLLNPFTYGLKFKPN